MCASGRFSGKQNNVHELWWNHKILFKSGYARKYNHTFPPKDRKRRLFNLRSWSCHFHTEVLHLYQDLFRLSRLFLDFDHRIYFSAWMDVKKGWICATFVTGNPYGTRVLGKSSQISEWAGTHWSRDIGDLNRTLTCPGQDREVFLPLNCLQGFDLKCWITFLSEEEKRWCDRSRSSDPSSCPFVLSPLLQMDFSPNDWFLTPDEEEGCLKMSPFVLGKRKQCRLGREKKLKGYSVFSSWEIAAALVSSFSNSKSANIHAMKEF